MCHISLVSHLHSSVYKAVIHEVEHQNDKEYNVGVYGGYSRLREMHKVNCHQQGCNKCQICPLEYLLAKGIHQRNHSDAEQCTHYSPAKGIHTKDEDTQ